MKKWIQNYIDKELKQRTDEFLKIYQNNIKIYFRRAKKTKGS